MRPRVRSGYVTEAADAGCHPTRKLPHIILLHDESSFDITVAPGVNVPAGYHRHFQSFDGKTRKLLVEGVGGPSWFTEYNVLTGLSVRSFGRFATSVTRIAAGHVYRGLPRYVAALRLSNLQPVSVLRFLSRIARFSNDGRHRALSGYARSRHPRLRSRQFLLRPRNRSDRAGTRQGTALPLCLHGGQSFPVG